MEKKIKILMMKYRFKNLRQLSEKMNVPYEIMKNWSCGRTTIGSVGKFKQIKIPEIFDYKLAELVGIVLGDGNICGNQLRIYGNKEEYEYYRSNIQKLLLDIFRVKSTIKQTRRNSNGILLTVNSILVCRYLTSIGLKDGSKIKNKTTIPDWIYTKKELIIYCLKGLFDTDGSFFSSSKNTEINILWNMGMNSSLPNEIRKALIKLNYSPTRIFDKGRKVALCKRSEVIRFFKEIKPRSNVQNDRFLKFFNESSNPTRGPKFYIKEI